MNIINRNIISHLHDWSKRKNRKPLVLRGARQVGKTTLVDEFGRNFAIDKVTTPKGKSFNLYNVPFYYAGILEILLNNRII